MKVKACRVCGSRKLAMLQLPHERETHLHPDFMDNMIAVRYLCGDCATIDEVLVFNTEEEWRIFLEKKTRNP